MVLFSGYDDEFDENLRVQVVGEPRNDFAPPPPKETDDVRLRIDTERVLSKAVEVLGLDWLAPEELIRR